MSSKAELQELVGSLEADVDALEYELDELKTKAIASANKAKARYKEAMNAQEAVRRETYVIATQQAETLKLRVKEQIKNLRATDRALLGIPALAALDAKLELLEELFGDM